MNEREEIQNQLAFDRTMRAKHREISADYHNAIIRGKQQLTALDEVKVREPTAGDVWLWPDGSIYFIYEVRGDQLYFAYLDDKDADCTDCAVKFLLTRGIFLCHIPSFAQGDHVIGLTREQLKQMLLFRPEPNANCHPDAIRGFSKLKASLEAHNE